VSQTRPTRTFVTLGVVHSEEDVEEDVNACTNTLPTRTSTTHTISLDVHTRFLPSDDIPRVFIVNSVLVRRVGSRSHL